MSVDPLCRQAVLQLCPGDPRLRRHSKIGAIDIYDARHARCINADANARLPRGQTGILRAPPSGHNGRKMFIRQLYNLRDLLRGTRPNHNPWRPRWTCAEILRIGPHGEVIIDGILFAHNIAKIAMETMTFQRAIPYLL